MSDVFDKTPDRLEIEAALLHLAEQTKDPTYYIPHEYEYYEQVILRANALYPHSLTLQKCAALLREDAFFEEGMDTAFHHHLSCFPPIWHTNRFFVVQIVLEGSYTSYIANREFTMSRGDICIISPDSRHAFSCLSDGNLLCLLIRKSTFERAFFGILQKNDNILADFFQRTLYNANPHPFLYFRSDWDPGLMGPLREAYREYLGHRSFQRYMMNNLIDQFFIRLLRDHEQDVVFSDFTQVRPSEDLIFMLKYMQEHYTTMTLKELADFFNYSERQVQRILKQSTGRTFMETIQAMKMNEAARLLRESRYPVSRIAADLGYINLGNFRKIFRKTYGISPAEYRKINSAGA